MFGALNRLISRLDAEPQEQKSGIQGAYGFQVLRNNNLELPIEPWFDFIIGINGRTIVRAYLTSTVRSAVWLTARQGQPRSKSLRGRSAKLCGLSD